MIVVPTSATKKRDRLNADPSKHPDWPWGPDPEADPSSWAPKPSKLEQEFTTPPESRESSFGPDQTVQGTVVTKRSKKRLDSMEPIIPPRPLFEDGDDALTESLSAAIGDWPTPLAKPFPASLSPHWTPRTLTPPSALAVHFPGESYCSSPYAPRPDEKPPGPPPNTVQRPTKPPISEEKKKPAMNLTVQIPAKGDCERDSRDSGRGSVTSCRGSVSGRESVKFNNLDFHEYDYHEDIAIIDENDLECMTPAAVSYLSCSPRGSAVFDFEGSFAQSPPSGVCSPPNTLLPELSLSPRNPFSCSFRRESSGMPKRGSELSLVPESEAFVESRHLQKTSNRKKTKKKDPPPTPIAHRLYRDNSLCDDKLLLTNLKSLTVGDPPEENQGRIFATEFYNHKPIGSGAFFEVFRVEQRKKAKLFAIKRSKRPFRSKRDRSEYLREIQMVSKLELHRNIITYYRAWQEDLHFLIQIEYCHSNLSDFVLGKKLSEKFLWDCFHQIAQGLGHVHRGGLIHLDIKPENILVDLKGHPVQPVYKLGDFGQARLKGSWADGSEGDAQYAAPEVIAHKTSSDPQTSADIFSLGLLMFELSTRYALPKNGELWHDIRAGSKSRELGVAMEKVKTKDLKKLILSCLEPEPTIRPTADAVVALCAAHVTK